MRSPCRCCSSRCSVHAQSSVTLYGSLDAGVGYVSNLRGARAFIAEQGTLQADRWGLTGVEDLGGGLKTVFKLESGFSTISGAMSSAGTLFNRQAYVGLSESGIGTVTLGRQTDFHFEMLGPLSTAQTLGDFSAFHPGNIDGLGNTVPVELSNTIKFRSRTIAGVTLGAMYGFTNQSSSTTGRSISFGATYGYGPLNLAAAYSEYRDRTLNLAGGLGLTSFQGIGLNGGRAFRRRQREERGHRRKLSDRTRAVARAAHAGAHRGTGQGGRTIGRSTAARTFR